MAVNLLFPTVLSSVAYRNVHTVPVPKPLRLFPYLPWSGFCAGHAEGCQGGANARPGPVPLLPSPQPLGLRIPHPVCVRGRFSKSSAVRAQRPFLLPWGFS